MVFLLSSSRNIGVLSKPISSTLSKPSFTQVHFSNLSITHTSLLSPKIPTRMLLHILGLLIYVIHFRPISLCNVIYKVISKLLVNRLKPFMDSIITPYQNAFIQGRNITDNILIAHVILDILRKKKGRKNCFSELKIDMSKAYDRVNWNFLKAVLIAMKFDAKWIKWIMERVILVHYTLLANDSLTKSFKPAKGLRQGDPLSPYLFLMCANILSISLLQTEGLNLIKGVKVGRNGGTFTHLLFANDSLLFFKKDNKSLGNLQRILDWYCSLSGQSINLSKFDLYFSPNMSKDD